MHTHIHTYTHTNTHTNTYTDTNTDTHIHTHESKHTHAHTPQPINRSNLQKKGGGLEIYTYTHTYKTAGRVVATGLAGDGCDRRGRLAVDGGCVHPLSW